MLETERYDRESDNNGEGAGHAAGVTPEPAEAGDAAQAADPGSSEAGGSGRRLFRRGRRAATRPAGPPVDDPGSGPGQPGSETVSVPAPGSPPPSEQVARESAAAAPGSAPPAVTFTSSAADAGTHAPAPAQVDQPGGPHTTATRH